MRNEKFEERLLELDFEIQRSVLKLNKPTDDTLVLIGLAGKSRSHCHMARELIVSNALAEAVIILRAAYEATILAIYLQQNPAKTKRYLVYSALTTLRNQMELLETLKRFTTEIPDEKEQLAYIEKQRQSILDSGILSEFKLSNEDLANWQRIKTFTNNAHFMKFEDLRNNIQKDACMLGLFETGFEVYNLGSQMAHANYDMVKSMIYFKKTHPLYNEHGMYRQILILLLANSKTLLFCGSISVNNFEQISKLALDIISEFAMD